MSEQRPDTALTRRQFLKAAGLVMGAVIAPASLTGGEAGSLRPDLLQLNSPLKIGVLLPPSKIYPALGKNFLAGMKVFFDQATSRQPEPMLQIVREDVDFGAGLTAQKSRKLVEVDKVHLVAGILNTAVAALLQDLFQDSKIPLIASNAGENLVRPGANSPYLFHNSLNIWQANWAQGDWAARRLGKKVFIASSFYESGYDTLHAFRLGFEAAGGKILDTYVSHIPPNPENFEALFSRAGQARPDFVYALYCGQEAVDFVRTYARSNLAGRIPLAGSGFLAEEPLISSLERAALGITTCFSWASSLTAPENTAFISAYLKHTGQAPDAFAVLGYDTARLIGEAANAAGGAERLGRMVQALQAAEFYSPRGRVRMNPQTHQLSGPLYLRQVQQRGSKTGNEIIAELEAPSDLQARLQKARSGPTSGWMNAYLSI